MSYLNLTCCIACGVGSSLVSGEQIKAQTERHGEYICESCEAAFEGILNTPKGEEIKISKGYGIPCETVITNDTIFYFDGPRVADPNRSFLGFGGSWLLVVKSYPAKYGARKKAIVTNNLWHSRKIPTPYQQKFKDAGKIDSEVIWVNQEVLKGLRDTLNGISYF